MKNRYKITNLVMIGMAILQHSLAAEDPECQLRNRYQQYQKVIESQISDHASKLTHEEESYLLGMTYFESHDYDRALLYLKQAAEYENANAEYVIGRIYEFINTYRDYDEAIHWYSLAEQHGNREASEAKARVINKRRYLLENIVVGLVRQKSTASPDAIPMHEDPEILDRQSSCHIF